MQAAPDAIRYARPVERQMADEVFCACVQVELHLDALG
jgi:hypothetical protein